MLDAKSDRPSFEEPTVPKAIYRQIYSTLKDEVVSGRLPYQSFIPSEHALTERFDCSRSSVRRALSQLAAEGYVQPMQGKGVRVIYNCTRAPGSARTAASRPTRSWAHAGASSPRRAPSCSRR